MLIDRIGEFLLITFTPFFLIGNAIRIIFKEVVKSHLTNERGCDTLIDELGRRTSQTVISE